MKTIYIPISILALILASGCTSAALRRNAINQSKTVSDFLADEVLYNLALYKDYYDGKRLSGLPAFVKLSSGNSQVQQSINAQLGLKIPATGGTEKDPQISGTHQTTDNWVFVPVVDPNELNRLFMLYRAQFTNLSAEEFKIALPASKRLDAQGRPMLEYTPVTNKDGHVKMDDKNQPVFEAIWKPERERKISEIPGAHDENNRSIDPWFSFEPPGNRDGYFLAGRYLNKNIWVTDRKGFFKFALLALGGTNGTTISKPPSALLLQNGNNIFMVPE